MSLAYILTVLVRRWRVILAAGLLGALAGFLLAERIPERYSATTSLVVSPLVANPFTNSREDVNIGTEREILSSREVARRASELLGESLDANSYLISHVDVDAPSGTQILQVAVQARSPEQAAAAADALSQAYLEFRREGADEIAAGYLERIDEQLADLANQPESEATEALQATLRQQRLTVSLSTAEPGRIIGAAVVPTAPSTPSKTVTVAAGTVLGILLGCALAIVRERSDRHVSSIDRLQLAVNAPIIPARSLDDVAAWDEVAQELEQAVESEAGNRQTILISGAGRVHGAVVGAKVTTQLKAALNRDLLSDSYVDDDPPESFRWVPIASNAPLDIDTPVEASAPIDNQVQFSLVDLAAEGSSARVARVARKCDAAVVLVWRQSTLADVNEFVSRVSDAGADPVVVYVTSDDPMSSDGVGVRHPEVDGYEIV